MLQSGLIYFVGRFGAAAITFLAIAAYTRLLSPSDYGTLAVVQAGVTLGYASMMQWLMISFARFMPQYREREDVIRSNIAVAYLLVAGLVLLIAPGVVHLFASDEVRKTAIILGVGVLLASGMAELTLVQFNMMLQPFRYAMFALLRVTVGTATGISLVYVGYGPIGALIGLLVGHLLILVQNYRRTWVGVQRTLVEKDLFRKLAAYGLVYAMNGALLAFIDVSDRYIIHWMLGSDAAGLYAAPYDLAMRSLHVLVLVAAMAGNPLIFRAFESKGEAAATPLIVQQFEMITAIALPAAITMAMLAPAIVSVLLGQPFHEAGERLLPWVALATVLQGLQSGYLSLAFALPKKPLRQTWFFLAGAVINIALNFYLIPRFGILGAAMATVTSFTVIVICSFIAGRRLYALPFPIIGGVKVAVACLLLVFILWPVAGQPLSLILVLRMIGGLALYVLALILLDVAGTRTLVHGLLRLMIKKAAGAFR